MAQTLADVRVAFKDETGVEYSCSFRDIDTLLYQFN